MLKTWRSSVIAISKAFNLVLENFVNKVKARLWLHKNWVNVYCRRDLMIISGLKKP